MPAAQEEGTRGTFFCFLAMPGPNRWNTRESTARGSNDPPNQSQDDQAYQSEDSEYDVEYTARKSREVTKDITLRTPEFRAEEDHHEFSYSFRQECQWYQDNEVVRLLRTRGNPPILGPRDISMFVKKQMLMDAVSWSLLWERRHEFDRFTRWQADFIR